MRRVSQWTLAFLAVSSDSASSAPTFTPFLPPSYPLAVRNPYLSTWLPGNLAAYLPTSSPQFWYGNDLGWSVMGRVGGTSYNLFGVTDSSSQSATVQSGSFSATHSIFTLTAGDARFTLDFFSPVSFSDYTRQSLPFSYLTIAATGIDGASPSVQLYSDIDESWTGQNVSTELTFSTSGTSSVYQLSAAIQQIYSQSANEQALWGEAVFASRSTGSGKLTVRSGPAATVRGLFEKNGALSGSNPSWTTGDVAGLAHDLGTVTSQTNVTYAIGHVREDAINYLGASQSHYYRATYPDTVSAVMAFIDDYDAAYIESAALEAEIQTKGTAIAGQNYTDILSLSVTQTFGGIDVTIPSSSLDIDDVSAFIKEISSDGNVNTIDIIVELIPFFKIFNVEYLRLMLDPVMKYLASGAWTLPYTIHDIGSYYPNATGHDEGIAEPMPVEECGNLLIMTAVYQNVSGNTEWASGRASLLAQYAEYLIANGEYPTSQLSTNDGLGEFTNMTQLGVKAAVGLAAYGQITGNATYTDYGQSFAETIYTNGVGVEVSEVTGETYFTLTYDSTAFFMMFNLYPDKLLDLDVFPDAAYKGQSDLYPTVRGAHGVPIEGLVDWGKTDWQMWSAAVAEESTRQEMINDAYAYVSNGLNTAPFADRYWVQGDEVGEAAANFRARPVLGAHFAIWALEG